MKSFNLSDWALEHRSLVWYFMIAFMAPPPGQSGLAVPA